MDILAFFSRSDPSTYLKGNANPVFTLIEPPIQGKGKIWWIKSSLGYPWDCMLYDTSFVYLWATESGTSSWTDPTIFKAFITPVVLCPRNIMRGFPNVYLTTPAPQVQNYVECKANGLATSLGAVRTQALGIFTLDHGGDLGPQPTLVISYQWGGLQQGTYPTREQYYLVAGQGLVRWDSATLDPDGLYTVTNISLFNMKASGVTPKPNFPCTLPPWGIKEQEV